MNVFLIFGVSIAFAASNFLRSGVRRTMTAPKGILASPPQAPGLVNQSECSRKASTPTAARSLSVHSAGKPERSLQMRSVSDVGHGLQAMKKRKEMVAEEEEKRERGSAEGDGDGDLESSEEEAEKISPRVVTARTVVFPEKSPRIRQVRLETERRATGLY